MRDFLRKFFRLRQIRWDANLTHNLEINTKCTDWHKRLKVHEERTFLDNQSSIVRRPIGNARRGTHP